MVLINNNNKTLLLSQTSPKKHKKLKIAMWRDGRSKNIVGKEFFTQKIEEGIKQAKVK